VYTLVMIFQHPYMMTIVHVDRLILRKRKLIQIWDFVSWLQVWWIQN